MADETSRKYYDFPPAGSGTSGGDTGLSSTATATVSGPTESAEASERASSAELSATASDIARRAAEQVSTATGAARQYLARNVDEYPMAAVLVAGLVGYGLGYLVHSGRQSR